MAKEDSAIIKLVNTSEGSKKLFWKHWIIIVVSVCLCALIGLYLSYHWFFMTYIVPTSAKDAMIALVALQKEKRLPGVSVNPTAEANVGTFWSGKRYEKLRKEHPAYSEVYLFDVELDSQSSLRYYFLLGFNDPIGKWGLIESWSTDSEGRKKEFLLRSGDEILYPTDTGVRMAIHEMSTMYW